MSNHTDSTPTPITIKRHGDQLVAVVYRNDTADEFVLPRKSPAELLEYAEMMARASDALHEYIVAEAQTIAHAHLRDNGVDVFDVDLSMAVRPR